MEIRVQKLGRESGTGSGTGENPGQGRMAAGPEGASTLNMEPSTGELGNRDKSLQAHPHCAELPRPLSPPSSIHLPGLLTGATAAFKRRAVGASGRGEALRVDRVGRWPPTRTGSPWRPTYGLLAPGEQLESLFYWGIGARLEHVQRQPSRPVGGEACRSHYPESESP